jgi:GTPase Era involved in 16S rRNA processing
MPQELFEAVQEAFLDFLSAEIPYRVTVLALRARARGFVS